VPGWAAEKPDEAVPSWGRDQPGEAVPGWGRDKPGETVPGWAGDEPGVLASGRAKETPGAAAGKGGEPAKNGTVDWAKPQANEPAEDWDRLSLSVSGTGSWNAFAAATPAKQEQKPGEAAEEKAAEPAKNRATGRDGDNGAGESPGSPAGGKAEPALTAAGAPLAAAKPNGRNGRGRNKAKQPTTPGPSALPAPTDPADEWISLLTADSAEELADPGADRPEGTPWPQ
jgi:hypothetical protein